MADYPSYNLNDPRNLSVKFSKSKIAKMSSKKKGEEFTEIMAKFLYLRCVRTGFDF